jgi:CheY-like chemotaxis protein
MNSRPDPTEKNTPPETFIEHVKEALENLYDLPYLQRHPLMQRTPQLSARSGEAASQWLRRRLINAVEALGPKTGSSLRSPKARLGNLLRMHYIEGMTIQEVASELGLSMRQVYRDLRLGHESVATILWAQEEFTQPAEPVEHPASTAHAEISRVEDSPRSVDLRTLLEHAQKTVEQLALQRNIDLQMQLTPVPVIVSTMSAMAQQLIISIASRSIQQSRSESLSIRVIQEPDQVTLVFAYLPETTAASVPALTPVILQLAEQLGWTIRQEDQPGGKRAITIKITVRNPVLLVIDDNEGLEQLIDRYLEGYPYRIIAARSSMEGLRLADDLVPAAVILDIMMPEIDGWELLQRLHTRPRTTDIPVIICSAFSDPELAYSLGASSCLQKPLQREELLSALRHVGVVQ